jgi:hypothetical protein
MKKILISVTAIIIVILSILYFTRSQPNQDNRAGIIYGDDHSYSLEAPVGWVIDNKAGQQYGLQAVFYKTGESWNNGTSTMYTNVIRKNSKISTIDQAIKSDLDNFKSHYPNIVISDRNDIKTMDVSGVLAKIKYSSDIQNSRYEAIAYIDAKNVIVMVILSSKTKESFDQNIDAFEKLVKSYFYVTDNVIVNTSK